MTTDSKQDEVMVPLSEVRHAILNYCVQTHTTLKTPKETADAICLELSRASLAAVQGDWQPITTVPKNGDEVLLAHANSQWLDQWISDVGGDYAEGGYWMMCDQWAEPEVPSHWKPLSPLPNTAAASSSLPAEPPPIDMILFCPNCWEQHVDAEESEAAYYTRIEQLQGDEFESAERWTNPPHRSHLCHKCGAVWRPADVPTNGVAKISTAGSRDNWTPCTAPAEPLQPEGEQETVFMISEPSLTDCAICGGRFPFSDTCIVKNAGGRSERACTECSKGKALVEPLSSDGLWPAQMTIIRYDDGGFSATQAIPPDKANSARVYHRSDDGWVTFGRVKVDIENETETFERIAIHYFVPSETPDKCGVEGCNLNVLAHPETPKHNFPAEPEGEQVRESQRRRLRQRITDLLNDDVPWEFYDPYIGEAQRSDFAERLADLLPPAATPSETPVVAREDVRKIAEEIAREFQMGDTEGRTYRELRDLAHGVISKHLAATPSPVAETNLCLLCSHNGVAPDGTCMVPVPICGDDYHGTRRCGCKCRFAAPVVADGDDEGETRPRIICLCGSTRFIEQFAITTWELEREGYIVLGCTLLPMWYCNTPSHFGEATGTKEQCDELHKRKIDLADEVLVLNIGGYIGESTRSEIEYAIRLGKPVRYIEDAAALRTPVEGEEK